MPSLSHVPVPVCAGKGREAKGTGLFVVGGTCMVPMDGWKDAICDAHIHDAMCATLPTCPGPSRRRLLMYM